MRVELLGCQPTRTASGSVAVHGAGPRVARASRIYVEGRHDAELVERVWGDDLRIEGVVVEYLEGIDDLADHVRDFGPGPERRVGVLVDHLVPGSKEARSYSFSSAPNGSELSFLIRDVPDGLMSTYMRSKAQLEDFIMFSGPYGSFYLRPTVRPVLMLAGGRDDRARPEEVRAMCEALGARGRLVLFEEAGHECFCVRSPARYRSEVASFLRAAAGRH